MQTLKNNKCLTCGGDIILSEDGKHGECSYCHRRYEYESGLTDDKSIIDYEQATEYWHTFKFADAKRKFLEVANANPEFPEAWWGAFVSEYGIEFVTNKFGGQTPTCHRAHTISVFDDENYKKAIETADDETKETFHSLGEKIETIRKGIIEKSNAGEIYDIFICFKATEVDDERRKTMDYDLGREIYSTLNKEGYRVFFAPETLLQIAEQEYEPHIYRALSTAKVMLLLCSDNREIESAWVKNEWSRFLDIHNGQGLIPICGNKFESYSPNSLPEDLRKLNAIEYNGRLFEQLLTKVHAYFPEIISKGIKVEPTTVDATVVNVENKNNLTTNGKWQFPTSSTMLNFETSTNPEILLLWGNTYYNLGMKENAVRYFTLSAEKGNMEAAFSLGYCYFSGDGVQKDKNKAIDLFKEAATKGYPSAQTFLAKCYLDGDGVDKDSNQAFYWCKKAAEQKDITAQDMLGTFYQIGIGVNRNIPEAVKWYKKAAMQGNASAQNALGVCYCHGDGITQDYNEAIKWFKKSAAQGNKKAAENLKKTENKKNESNTLSAISSTCKDSSSTIDNKKKTLNVVSATSLKNAETESPFDISNRGTLRAYHGTNTNVIIPEGVITIKDKIFQGMPIESVTFPNTLKEIGKRAFKECYQLSNISFSESITTIGDGAFEKCTKLRKVIIPDNIENLGRECFSKCRVLSDVIINPIKTQISYYTFNKCRKLPYTDFRLIYSEFCSANWANVKCNENKPLKNPATFLRIEPHCNPEVFSAIRAINMKLKIPNVIYDKIVLTNEKRCNSTKNEEQCIVFPEFSLCWNWTSKFGLVVDYVNNSWYW